MNANLQSTHPEHTPSLVPRELTLKQQRFVEAYCGVARGNGTEAARLASYEGNDVTLAGVAYENLRKPQIKSAINERLDALAMDKGEILSELSDIGRSEWRDHVEVILDKKTGAVVDAKLRLTDKVKALDILSKIRRMQGPETAIQVNVVNVDHSGALRAIEHLLSVMSDWTREQAVAFLTADSADPELRQAVLELECGS